MVDFHKKLAEMRLKEKLAAAVPKEKRASMIPVERQKKQQAEAEVVPDIAELDLPPADRLQLVRLILQCRTHGEVEKTAKKAKKALSDRIKTFAKQYDLSKFMVDGSPCNYYKSSRTTISAALLHAQGVSPTVIAAATVVTESWSFKASANDQPVQIEGDDNAD